MTTQTAFNFDCQQSGEDLMVAGIQTASDHADSLQKKWSDDAFLILREFISRYDIEFMTEDLRHYAETVRKFVAPASQRAWGGIMVRAKKSGLIETAGIRSVKNSRAHCANATIWKLKNK